MESKSHHITLLVIYSLGGGHTHTSKHTRIQTFADESNSKKPGTLVCGWCPWFKNNLAPSTQDASISLLISYHHLTSYLSRSWLNTNHCHSISKFGKSGFFSKVNDVHFAKYFPVHMLWICHALIALHQICTTPTALKSSLILLYRLLYLFLP